MEKIAILLTLLVLITGCVYQQAPIASPEATESISQYQPSTQVEYVLHFSEDEERLLVKEWLTPYSDSDEELNDDVEDALQAMSKLGIHAVEVYQGSLYFYKENYHFIFLPDWEEDLRDLPKNVGEEGLHDLTKMHGGEFVSIPDGTAPGGFAISFKNKQNMREFLKTLWSIKYF